MKRIVGLFLLFTILLIVVLLFNLWRFESKQMKVEALPEMSVSDAAVNRLSEVIQIPTISGTPYIPDSIQLEKFTTVIDSMFPLVHEKLEIEVLAKYTPLYKWTGKNPSAAPIMLIAHYDVVPVENPDAWDAPPFSGAITNGFIYGRGALDDKLSVMGILEAAEMLLKEGYQPAQDIYFSFGHDEETTGTGAQAVAEYLKENDIRPAFVLDEGSIVADHILPGFDGQVGLIGVSEKGYANAKITATGEGGHSSMPPEETAVGILSKAILAIQNEPMPQRQDGLMQQVFEHTGPEMSFTHRLLFSNLWLFGPIVDYQLAQSPSTNASTRTTAAPTMLKGSIKENVLAQTAEAIVNFRIYPGDHSKDILTHLEAIINDDRVSVEFLDGVSEAAPLSSFESQGFLNLVKTTRQIWPETITTPSLCVATTDSRYFVGVAENIYRFLPVVATSEDIGRIHGSNERISVEGYKDLVRFYHQFLLNFD